MRQFARASLDNYHKSQSLTSLDERTPSGTAAKELGLRYDCYVGMFEEDPALKGTWVQLSLDAATRQFLTECFGEGSSSPSSGLPGWTDLLALSKYIAKPALKWIYGHTDTNGILGTGEMFLLSTSHARHLLGKHAPPDGSGRLLDVGAGCGRITSCLSPLFGSITATEAAQHMCPRLEQRGFRAVHTDDLDCGIDLNERFDVVSVFNVIDRCDKPQTLIRQVRERMAGPDSLLILATPLPLRPSVEKGTTWVSPSESILPPAELPAAAVVCNQPYSCCGWERDVKRITKEFLAPLGFHVLHVSRVPYLSKGDGINRAYYSLDDAIFVCRLDPEHEDNARLRAQPTRTSPAPSPPDSSTGASLQGFSSTQPASDSPYQLPLDSMHESKREPPS